MEKTKYERALGMACNTLADIIWDNGCIEACPLEDFYEGECYKIHCKDKEAWKEYFLKEVEKDE